MACVEVYFGFEAFSMESSQHKYLADVLDSNDRRRCGADLAPNTKHYVGYELREPSTGDFMEYLITSGICPFGLLFK